MANNRARLNEQLFNQAVSLGHSPQNFGGRGGGGAYTNYLRSLIAQGPRRQAPRPTPPPTPAPIKQAQAPRRLDADSDGGNLKIKKKSKRKSQALSKGTGQLRIDKGSTAGVTGGAGASSGGINV
jgi:hypothetical protein